MIGIGGFKLIKVAINGIKKLIKVTGEEVEKWVAKKAESGDVEVREIKFFENEAQIKHIFRKKKGEDNGGHFEIDTPENRKLILDTVNDEKNFVVVDKDGVRCYSKLLEDGREVWVRVWRNTIRNAGVNDIPRSINK